MEDLRIAKKRLKEKGLTLSIIKEKKILFETSSHGISGFLRAIKELGERLDKASAADKIIGKAVALLCLCAGIDRVYGSVMSREAQELFEESTVHAEWDELVDNIAGHFESETCIFEKLAAEITEPAEAYKKLKALHDSLEQRKVKSGD